MQLCPSLIECKYTTICVYLRLNSSSKYVCQIYMMEAQTRFLHIAVMWTEDLLCWAWRFCLKALELKVYSQYIEIVYKERFFLKVYFLDNTKTQIMSIQNLYQIIYKVFIVQLFLLCQLSFGFIGIFELPKKEMTAHEFRYCFENIRIDTQVIFFCLPDI